MKIKVKIMRGTPGSGKSTWARNWASANTAVIASADDFFHTGPNGEYRFVSSRIGDAHMQCWERFVAALAMGYNVVVDNTNCTAKEIERYYNYALEKGCDVEIIEVQSTPESWKRNSHGVPEASIRRMEQRMSNPLPAEWMVIKVGPFND